MKIKIYIFFSFLFNQLSACAQPDSLRHLTCKVFDNTTNKILKNAKLILISPEGKSSEIYADTLGEFHIYLKKKINYEVAALHKKYIMASRNITSENKHDTLIFKLRSSISSVFFQEFTFQYNSVLTKDTLNFSLYGLNNYCDSTLKIKVIGYNAPDESTSIALKRAHSVIEGFVSLGACRNCFVSAAGAYPRINADTDILVNGNKITLPKQTKLSNDYISQLNGSRQLALYEFLRRVQLEWNNEE